MRQLKITDRKKNVEMQIKKRPSKTLLEHIEHLIELAEGSKLSDEFYQKAKTSINFISKKLELSTTQAILFAIFMEKSDDNNILISDISKFLGCRNIKTVSMMNDVDELEKRRLVRCCRRDRRIRYRVPFEVINAVKQNIVYKPKETKNLTIEQLFLQMEVLFDERIENELSYDALALEIKSLLSDNISLSFCQQMAGYESELLYEEDYILLLLVCHLFINNDDDCVGFHDFENVFESKRQLKYIKSRLLDGSAELMEYGILEYANDNGFANKEYYRITSTAKQKLFSELNVKAKQADAKKGLISCQKIDRKELFYNESEKTQITQLVSLLQQENFISVQQRLSETGMRKGFACLFHGAPGTGKTETVYQLARQTGRDIMMVDISQTKSCWYGESEKLIKEVFERYRNFSKSCDTVPILLFNEADAVIGKRKGTDGRASIDQTENTIQNIILQEMENLEGIMIATTNLTQNLDKAFERRFLYKIEFRKPSIEAKQAIWKTMIPNLSQAQTEILSQKYDFSGGQIENIARKQTVETIISGSQSSFEALQSYCETELLVKSETRQKIGY